MQIKPAFNKNNIAVVLSADDNYVPYLAVTIKSMLCNKLQSQVKAVRKVFRVKQ